MMTTTSLYELITAANEVCDDEVEAMRAVMRVLADHRVRIVEANTDRASRSGAEAAAA